MSHLGRGEKFFSFRVSLTSQRAFENVGGVPFQQCIARLNDFARVAICGLIASYNGAPTALPDMRVILITRSLIQGFIVSDDMGYWPKALKELGDLADSGELKVRETVSDGLETAPEAFIGLLSGRNFGKQVVKLA